MGKTSKRKVPFAAKQGNLQVRNRFEAVTGKQKFKVIGRRPASNKNINQARSEAIDKV
jgi:hypothetical protein